MQNLEPTLPSNRAFIVQFRRTTASTADVWVGRVEHLTSGQATRFDSWEHLQQFIEDILTKVGESLP